MYDEFGTTYGKMLHRKLTGQTAERALQAINAALDIRGQEPAPSINRIRISKLFSELAYFSHPENEFDNSSLKPLVASKIGELIIEHIQKSLESIEVAICCLLRGTKDKTVNVIITNGSGSDSETSGCRRSGYY